MTAMYASVVKNGRISIDDVPDVYRKDVQDFINGTQKDDMETDVVLESPKPVSVRQGALYIPKVEAKINGNELSRGLSTKFMPDQFLTAAVLSDKPMPENLSYELIMFEQSSPYLTCLDVTLTPDETGFKIHSQAFNGETPGMQLFRVDIKFKSDNYEDMRATVYFVAQ